MGSDKIIVNNVLQSGIQVRIKAMALKIKKRETSF